MTSSPDAAPPSTPPTIKARSSSDPGNGAESVLTPRRPTGHLPVKLPPVHDSPDLGRHQPDPAHGHGQAAPQVAAGWCLSLVTGPHAIMQRPSALAASGGRW